MLSFRHITTFGHITHHCCKGEQGIRPNFRFYAEVSTGRFDDDLRDGKQKDFENGKGAGRQPEAAIPQARV